MAKRIRASSEEMEEEGPGLVPKRKVFLLFGYRGTGYFGMQRQVSGVPTIEEDLLIALRDTGAITQDMYINPTKAGFQRAARTDKGVHALRQVVSVKVRLTETLVADMNAKLPPHIRVFAVGRVTKGFCAKNRCDFRRYHYVAPTYAFAPMGTSISKDYRLPEDQWARLNELLGLYKGTHNFHNFTSGKRFEEASANRFIISCSAEQPRKLNGLEVVVISIHGQSFMIHQIRKMVGLVSAILRGYTDAQYLQRAMTADRLDVPRIPSLGLYLDAIAYDDHNRRMARDKSHSAMPWGIANEEVEVFHRDYILATISGVELETREIQDWLETLDAHNYGLLTDAGPAPTKCDEQNAED